MKPLSRSFYERPTLVVARELLGQRLRVRQADGRLVGGRIVEVEAYLGLADKASHARVTRRGGRDVPTERSAPLFGPVGHAYVYLIYGMHHCMNAVAHPAGGVGAVLLRALEPEGVDDPSKKSMHGPARLCSVLGIDRRMNRLDMTAADAPLFIAAGPGVADDDVHTGPRIGVDYAGDDALLPYRFCVRTSPHLSRGGPSRTPSAGRAR